MAFGCYSASFAAAAQHRDDLAGVAEREGIEGGPHREHRVHVGFGEDERQEVAFIQTDTVLARDCPTHTNTNLHQLASRFFHAPHFICETRVETDEGMQIAIARVKQDRKSTRLNSS